MAGSAAEDVIPVARARRWRWPRLARVFGWAGLLGPVVVLLGPLVGAQTGTPELGIPIAALGLLSTLLGPLLGAGAAVSRSIGENLAVRATGLETLEGVRLAARQAIAHGAAIGGGKVRLVLIDGSKIELDLADPFAADHVIELLGLGPRQRRATFEWRVKHTERRFLFGLVGGALVIAGGLAAVGMGPASIACACLAGLWTGAAAALPGTRRELSVGRDGVRWPGLLGDQTVLFASVTAIRPTERGVELVRKDGKRTEIRLDAWPALEGAIRGRIQAAFESGEEGASDPGSLLGRAGRTVEAWRAAVGAALEGGLREAAPTEDRLVAVLESPASPPDVRIGAALALAARPEHAGRIRVAADACVSPKMRVALESVAGGAPDEGLIEAAAEESAAAARRR